MRASTRRWLRFRFHNSVIFKATRLSEHLFTQSLEIHVTAHQYPPSYVVKKFKIFFLDFLAKTITMCEIWNGSLYKCGF